MSMQLTILQSLTRVAQSKKERRHEDDSVNRREIILFIGKPIGKSLTISNEQVAVNMHTMEVKIAFIIARKEMM